MRRAIAPIAATLVGLVVAAALFRDRGVPPPAGIDTEHERGPRGGDELTIITRGHNCGWPSITYGILTDEGSLLRIEPAT